MTRIAAVPRAAAVRVTRAPVARTATTLGADDDAAKASGSWSGSANANVTSTSSVLSGCNVRSGSAPTADGARLAPAVTVTVKNRVALRPPGSAAVTWMVAAPTPTAVSVTRAPAASTVTTSGGDEDTA